MSCRVLQRTVERGPPRRGRSVGPQDLAGLHELFEVPQGGTKFAMRVRSRFAALKGTHSNLRAASASRIPYDHLRDSA